MIECHKKLLAATTAFIYKFYESLKVWPLNISVAPESASLGQGYILDVKILT